MSLCLDFLSPKNITAISRLQRWTWATRLRKTGNYPTTFWLLQVKETRQLLHVMEYTCTFEKMQLNNHTGLPEEAPFLWLLKEGNVFDLDRGFRDTIPDLETCGFEAHIPPTKSRAES